MSEAKPASGAPPAWIRTVTTVSGAVLLAIVLFVLGSALLPGWWAAVVTGWVGGVASAGVLVGLLCGAVFTLVPVAIGFIAVRWHRPWRTRLIIGGVALLLTLPLVLTIAIDVASTTAALDAKIDMQIGAPSFTGATYTGALGSAAVATVLILLLLRWRRSRKEVRALRGTVAKNKETDRARRQREEAAEEARTQVAREAAERAKEREGGAAGPDSQRGEPRSGGSPNGDSRRKDRHHGDQDAEETSGQ
ncbi:hypothetical protein [Ruania rhizosphaerae]|uniref:hypothetical protein n=1 Tax=Ruania rhizosphaerae TaxID=1840413 RepID=UPI00135A83D5|nr:hypothetical protein [Ruania rhizosphaerae]